MLGADGAGERTVDDLGRSGELARPTLWVLGNEAWGLPAEHAALIDRLVALPMYGRAESLNLSTAAAVCLYASATAQRPLTPVPAGDEGPRRNLSDARVPGPTFLDCPGRIPRRTRRGEPMSGPNKSYDPVQVAPLDAEHVEAMVAEALAAFAAATSVAELKQARLAHAGDRSPIALANREIGALPPQARKDAGSRIGQARGADQPGAAGARGRDLGRRAGPDPGRGAGRRHAAGGHSARSGRCTRSRR